MDAIEHRRKSLWLIGLLHAFTHLYHVALMPLYLLIQSEFKLQSAGQAPLLVTVMGVAYLGPSYFTGILADRFSGKRVLAVGLAINGLGFVGLSIAHTFNEALCWAALAGLGGSTFHPAATALIARLFPTATGKALGQIGIGASIGFLVGPIYCGWRAVQSGGWRAPVLEIGIAGMVVAGVFAWLADSDVGHASRHTKAAAAGPMFPNSKIWLLFLAACVGFSLRDFGGAGLGSLSSLFMQQAQGFDPQKTGLILSGIFLGSAISNPILGGLSDRGRGRWLVVALVTAALFVALFPHVAPWAFGPVLIIYGFFFLASYPIVEAAVMESVPDSHRGRVFGLFITIGGLVGTSAHGTVGSWVSDLGTEASQPARYYWMFGLLSSFIIISLLAIPCLKAIRFKEAGPNPGGSEPSP